MFRIASCLLALVFFYGCNGEPPIKVQTAERYNPIFKINSKFLIITAISDSVHITDIKLNRGKGNCKVGGIRDSGDVKIDRTLEYGQTWELPVRGCSEILEVEVRANGSSWSLSPGISFE